VLLEMLAGRQLFALSHDDVHLHMMEKLLGKKVGLLVLGFRVRGFWSMAEVQMMEKLLGKRVETRNPKPETWNHAHVSRCSSNVAAISIYQGQTFVLKT